MESFAKFRNWLLVTALALVFSLGGYIWSNHISAEAATTATEHTRLDKIEAEMDQLKEIVIRLDAYIAHQQKLNERLVNEHR